MQTCIYQAAATCEVLVGQGGSRRMDLSSIVKATGYARCNLPAGHERDDHAVCGFHAEYGGDLPFTVADLRDTDVRPSVGGPRHRAS